MVGSLPTNRSGGLRKTLIVRLSSLGDIVHTLPAVLLLRESVRDICLHWVVKERYKELLLHHPAVDRVIPVDTDRWKAHPFSKETITQVTELARTLQGEGYDLAIDFQGSIKSGFITCLTRAPRRLGFSPPYCREPLSAIFTNRWVVPTRRRCHKVELYAELLRGIGIEVGKIPDKCIPVPVEEKRLEGFVARELGGHRPRVALNPGARWETKRWPMEYWAALGDALILQGIKVIVVWGPGEKALALELAERMRCFPVLSPFTDIMGLIYMVSRMDLLIASDTGPLHLAAAIGVPVVGIYGPTDPVLNGPYGQVGRVIQANLSCSGCWKRSCSDLECMRGVTPEKVLKLALRVIHSRAE